MRKDFLSFSFLAIESRVGEVIASAMLLCCDYAADKAGDFVASYLVRENPVRGARGLYFMCEFVQHGWRGELLSGDRQHRSMTASATELKTRR